MTTAAARRSAALQREAMMDIPATDTDPLLVVEEEETVDSWGDRLLKFQRIALICAHVLAALSLLAVLLWISALGGLSWKEGEMKQVFNWHPLLMITAFSFMTVASLSFRFRHENRSLLKWTHGMAWTVAILCAMIALIAVFKSHNDPSGYIANLYSLHSWIGCAVIGLYISQLSVGVFTFAWPVMSPKTRILQIHKFFGPFIYNCVAITILLGIQEKEGFVGCAYPVRQADTFPIKHFLDIPSVCRISHALGILVLGITLCTNLALHDFGKEMVDQHML
jgi:cytochrome b-561